MTNKTETTFWAKIYLAGSLETIKNVCREYCKQVGLCVTLSETLFIYTGGEEYGVEIGLINYPRFPATPESILNTAIQLADKCRNAAFQHSYLILTPETTIWNSTREIESKEVKKSKCTCDYCVHKTCGCDHNESCPSCLL